VAFKRDCYSVDLICLLISDGDKQIEINEEDVGWDVLVWNIEKHLPGAVPYASWWAVVAFPAFATNTTTIYSRE